MASIIRGACAIVVICILVIQISDAKPEGIEVIRARRLLESTGHVKGVLGKHLEASKKIQPHHRNKEGRLDTPAVIAGSSLPDCSHACGPCLPCRRITISYYCELSRNSEACPSTYRCMCGGRSFPVP
ncbi:hypothetical protein O6H91_04G095100 [Diphasiastrum complanatum]|uniref:Uncharacterized protein n=1 Tax=Diphasiastrum complanatum TaxID=34168 RepID=A0ACC2DZ89_DIPCM|nr:hypothetical protein O6H91_04G095100 [Diphasiastrum complanatum]